MHIADVQKTYAMVVGAVLVLLGLVGFVNAPILGIFGVNLAQNLLHLVGGGIIIWQAGKKTNMWTGIIALVVGLLWFAEGLDGGLLASIFAINAAISYLHIAVGVVSLGVAYGVKE